MIVSRELLLCLEYETPNKYLPILTSMISKDLEDLYVELIDQKEKYPSAFTRVNNEYSRRIDEQIERINAE